jgi:hypothetical protein
MRVYFRNFLKFLAVGFVVVAPAESIVSGVGLNAFSSGYDATPPLAASTVPLIVQVLVSSPLIAAMCVYAVRDLSDGQAISVRRAIQRGLDAFAPMFVPVLAAFAAEVLAVLVLVVPLAVALGTALVPTIIVPLILAIRWYFAPQAVVADDARRLDALRTSWDVTRFQGLRVAAVVLLGMLVLQQLAGFIATPLLVLARSADSGALIVAYNVVLQTLAVPALGVIAAFLYFDLRARRAARTG